MLLTPDKPGTYFGLRQPRRLYLPFLLYCIAVGAVHVPKVNIILALLCIKDKQEVHFGHVGSDDICDTPTVHAEMGRFLASANVISGVLCAFSSPILGMLSDRYGRKPLIAFSALGMLSGDTISLLAAWFPATISVYWILLEFVIGGLTGAFFTTVALVQSYAADCSSEENRAKVFSTLHACMYLGLAIGPAAGALLVDTIGHGNMLLAFYAAGACHLTFICYILFGIPESSPAALRARAGVPSSTDTEKFTTKLWERLHWRNLVNFLSVFWPAAGPRSSSTRSSLLTLAAVDALAFGTQMGLPPLLILFSESQFGWKNLETNLLLSLSNVIRAIILAILLPLAMKLIKSRYASLRNTSGIRLINSSAVCIGIVFDLLGYVGFGISYKSPLFIASSTIIATGALVSPVAQSSMTTYVRPDKIGQLFGAIGFLHSLARASMPSLMQVTYSLTIENSPHLPFWGLAFLFAMVLLASLHVRKESSKALTAGDNVETDVDYAELQNLDNEAHEESGENVRFLGPDLHHTISH